MANKVEVYRRLREEKGMTYEEIGELFGISKQAVHDSLNRKRDGFRESTVRKVRYIGLRNWMLENRVNVGELEKRCGENVRLQTLTNRRRPLNLGKKNIDAILAVTGLTYEECFKEDKQDD